MSEYIRLHSEFATLDSVKLDTHITGRYSRGSECWQAVTIQKSPGIYSGKAIAEVSVCGR